MATVRERRIFTTEEVLELLEGDDDNTQIDYDSSESEIEDDGDGAVFPENSVGNRDISDESPSSLEEENESSSESEVDRREFLQNERQERSRQLHQQINNARGRNRGFRG